MQKSVKSNDFFRKYTDRQPSAGCSEGVAAHSKTCSVMENISDGIITKLAKFCSLRNRGLGNFLIGFTVCCFNSLFESSIETRELFINFSIFPFFVIVNLQFLFSTSVVHC